MMSLGKGHIKFLGHMHNDVGGCPSIDGYIRGAATGIDPIGAVAATVALVNPRNGWPRSPRSSLDINLLHLHCNSTCVVL